MNWETKGRKVVARTPRIGFVINTGEFGIVIRFTGMTRNRGNSMEESKAWCERLAAMLEGAQ